MDILLFRKAVGFSVPFIPGLFAMPTGNIPEDSKIWMPLYS